ncbi:MAG: ribonuclease III [Melioribacteraceae bacterium]|nr:ribonuclease III [Melioribacteraceae bacterium]
MFGYIKSKIWFLFLKKSYKRDLDKNFLKNFISLQKLVGVKISNPNLYLKALTHRSYLEVNPSLNKSNERLEFLGDSVLNMIVAKFLFKKFPEKDEGFLTKVRSAIVNRYHLYKSAEELKLENLILYNQKYLRGSEEGFQTIMADAIESLIAAIYLDKGIRTTEKFIYKYIIKSFDFKTEFLIDKNYKGQLLEYTHAKKLPNPHYKVINEAGPSHKKIFNVQVFIGNEIYGEGSGKNKKLAEQEASRKALQKIHS